MSEIDLSGYNAKQIAKFKEEGVSICCKDVKYDFSFDTNADEAVALAKKTVKEMYLANQQDEIDEREEMLQSGEISDYSEYDGMYLDDYDEQKFMPKIMECASDYLRNYYDISNKIVVTFPYDKAQNLTSEDIKLAVEEKSGLKVKSLTNFDIARQSEVLSQKSFDAIGNAMESNDYKTFLNLKSNLEKYSCSNVGLVYAQKPTAEAVKGFKAWLELDRSVEKGEKAIYILAPNLKVLKTEENVENYAKSYYVSDKEKAELLEKLKEKGEVTVLTSYSSAYVFDISQTRALSEKGEEVAQLLKLDKPLKENAENYKAVVESIEGISVYPSPCLVKEVNGNSEQENLFNSIKDYAREIFSKDPSVVTGIKSYDVSKGNQLEMEVLMSAYLVCKHIGIECEDKLALAMTKVMDNLTTDKMLVGKRNIFQTAFDRADKFSTEFNKAFDKNFEKQMELEQSKVNDKADVSKSKKDIGR